MSNFKFYKSLIQILKIMLYLTNKNFYIKMNKSSFLINKNKILLVNIDNIWKLKITNKYLNKFKNLLKL